MAKDCIEIRHERFAAYVVFKERDDRGYPHGQIVTVAMTKWGAIHRAKREMEKRKKKPEKQWKDYRLIWRKCP